MVPFNTRLFLGQHLRSYNFYSIEDDLVVFDFMEKCPGDVVLILRLYEVEYDEPLISDIVSELFITHKIYRDV
jgi:hypothetical protein